jgi:carbamoyl-phosphate synthase large subunit
LVPYAYDDNYLSAIQKIVGEEQIDLIIPSTDYEVYYLALYSESIACSIAVSDIATAELYLDKYKTFLAHQELGIPFADSYEPSKYKGEFSEIIVKPKKGRGSRGISINPASLNGFSDRDYMVQELHKGMEVTTAFYVSKSNELHGQITMSRTLENGATNFCKVVSHLNKDIEGILTQIITQIKIKGSANLQSIVTADNRIIPFEMNCRISGTNSIRSNFGFEDVKYTLEEYLYDLPLSKPHIIDGIAVRILMDVIYPNAKETNSLIDGNANHFIF